jgi:hypothetical protein
MLGNYVSGMLGPVRNPLLPARYTVERTYLNPRSLSFQARQRRFEIVRPMIERIIARKGFCRIADIGGTE